MRQSEHCPQRKGIKRHKPFGRVRGVIMVTISGYATLLRVPCFILLVWKATYSEAVVPFLYSLTDNCSVWVHLQGRSSQHYHRETIYDWSEDYHCSAFQEAIFEVSCSLLNGKKLERNTISFAVLCLLLGGSKECVCVCVYLFMCCRTYLSVLHQVYVENLQGHFGIDQQSRCIPISQKICQANSMTVYLCN